MLLCHFSERTLVTSPQQDLKLDIGKKLPYYSENLSTCVCDMPFLFHLTNHIFEPATLLENIIL